MVGWFGRAAIAASGLCLLAASVPAQVTDPTKLEQKCESTVGKTITKFVGSKSKCISKCFATARKTSGPYTGCKEPAYTDTATHDCITGSLKGAEAKAGAGISKACAAMTSCPACYGTLPGGSAGRCADGSGANSFVVDAESDVDAPFGPGTGFPSLIYCLESGGTTPTKDEAKCEDGVVKALVKFVGSKQKCEAKCYANFYKGSIPGGCDPSMPGGVSDPATVACIKDPTKGAEAKASAAIIKACTVAVPGCYTGGAAGAASTFVNAVEAKVDQRTPQIQCGSPSGAFVE
jgi:hypothetical protein